jgi:hypothetical protein
MKSNWKAWLLALGMFLAFGYVSNFDYIYALEKENTALKMRAATACGEIVAGVRHE